MLTHFENGENVTVAKFKPALTQYRQSFVNGKRLVAISSTIRCERNVFVPSELMSLVLNGLKTVPFSSFSSIHTTLFSKRVILEVCLQNLPISKFTSKKICAVFL